MQTHIDFMNRCVTLGEHAMLQGNPPVGSILVHHGKIIGMGQEAGTSGKDITKHAEIEAIRDALNRTNPLKGSTLYTTHEPCIMCSYVIRHLQIATIVYGSKSKHVGGHSSTFNVLETTDIPKWGRPPTIISGILEDACLALSKTYENSRL